MDSIIMRKRNGLMLVVALAWNLTALAAMGQGAECLVKEGTRLAIAGDSITEQKLYSKFIETYLVACGPVKNVVVIQYGWGETPRLIFTCEWRIICFRGSRPLSPRVLA